MCLDFIFPFLLLLQFLLPSFSPSLLERLLNILICPYPAKAGGLLGTLVTECERKHIVRLGSVIVLEVKEPPCEGATQGTVLANFPSSPRVFLECETGSSEFYFIRKAV